MNILLLNWKDIRNPDVGGAEILLFELVKRLIKDGHTVTWFCRTFPGYNEQEDIDGIRVIRRGGLYSVYREAWKYYRNLSQKPDRVVESVNTMCWQTPLYVPQSQRIVLVNQLAKEVFFYEKAFPLSYCSYALERWEYATYRSSRFLCYSRSTKEDLVGFGIPEKQIAVFPLGVDHGRYIPGEKAPFPLFIFVGRLARMKRADLCIEAMRGVAGKYPEAKLAVIGYGPEEEHLKRLIRVYGLERQVYIVNTDNLYFENDEKDMKVKLMQQAWALVLPSVKEGWGMVVTEAAACGTPAIVTNVTGLKDSVVDGRTGNILSVHPSADEVSRHMLSVIEHKGERQRLSRNAREWANKFSWEKSYAAFRMLLFI